MIYYQSEKFINEIQFLITMNLQNVDGLVWIHPDFATGLTKVDYRKGVDYCCNLISASLYCRKKGIPQFIADDVLPVETIIARALRNAIPFPSNPEDCEEAIRLISSNVDRQKGGKPPAQIQLAYAGIFGDGCVPEYASFICGEVIDVDGSLDINDDPKCKPRTPIRRGTVLRDIVILTED